MHATVPMQQNSARRWLRCCSAILISLASMLALTSCVTGTEAIKAPPVAPAAPPPAIDRSLLAKCPEELPPAVDSRLPSLLANHDEVAAIYHECASGKGGLVEAVQEWQRTAWEWYCNSLDAVGLDASSCRAGLEPRR
ncbi:MAG: hypothetical protein JNM58_00730 [Xanthomonadaceae bacterium]|nr:hypothetical protein [Xanthomonadaceae bacterium]